jgi:hypothetical protein
VIDHGSFQHVNNENVVELPDGSMHMTCTVLTEPWVWTSQRIFPAQTERLGTAAPSHMPPSSRTRFPISLATRLMGERTITAATCWCMITIYGRSTIAVDFMLARTAAECFALPVRNPAYFQSEGSVADTNSYANDVKKFKVSGETWYVMLLYIEELMFGEVISLALNA